MKKLKLGSDKEVQNTAATTGYVPDGCDFPVVDVNNETQGAIVSGNYDPSRNTLYKALNIIENEIFYRQTDLNDTFDPHTESERGGILAPALISLNYKVF